MQSRNNKCYAVVLLLAAVIGLSVARAGWAADKPNIVMLMTDDTGWGDFGAYSGGGWGLGHSKGWTVISIKSDWKQIVASEK